MQSLYFGYFRIRFANSRIQQVMQASGETRNTYEDFSHQCKNFARSVVLDWKTSYLVEKKQETHLHILSGS
jgi:hypothetical protein